MTKQAKIMEKLFQRSPTRELEEVEKVNSRRHAEREVKEFFETDSAHQVLKELSSIVSQRPEGSHRFLYIHATFGSGKTLLLKLINYATGEDEERKHLASELSNRFPGFSTFRQKLTESQTDHLVPIFLNLLDRDPNIEPPIPLLIYQALGDRLGYPIDPSWLLEWIWRLDIHNGLWEPLKEFEFKGKTFHEVLKERASLRGWLYQALPAMSETDGTQYETKEEVKKSIEKAKQYIDPEEFDPQKLVKRLEETINHFEEKSDENYEFLIGLDEIALFIWKNRRRYQEFQNTMEALFEGPNPPIIGTGQWSLKELHKEFTGEIQEKAWYTNEIGLKSADTEAITRKRWLEKDPNQEENLREMLANSENWTLMLSTDIQKQLEENQVQAYPFRYYDLWLLRNVMEELITRGRPTEHEYVQGRALLALVRSLFTKFDWSEKEVGALVPWNRLFDLLVEETTYVPTWVQDKLENLKVTFGEGSLEDKIAKVLYLINQVESVPATASNVVYLLLPHVKDDPTSLQKDVEQALGQLEKKRYLHREEIRMNEESHTVYQLLSKEEFNVAEEIDKKQGEISSYQLGARIQRLLQMHELLLKEESKHEISLGDERNLPVFLRYSILENIPTTPGRQFNAVVVRVLADEPENLAREANQWQEINSTSDGLEDLLVVIKIQEGIEQRLRWLIASEQVLSRKSGAYPELERKRRDEERKLEQEISEHLKEAQIFDPDRQNPFGKFGDIFDSKLLEEVETKFPNRKSLSTPLREIDDAHEMAKFFQQKSGASWPLGEEDAEMLGVDVIQAEIKDGWAGEFLDRWGDEPLVTGKELLAELEGRNGNYRGTPRESLAALLLCLATATKIGLKKNGEPILDPREMGRAVRTIENIRSLETRPGAGYGQEEITELKDVFEFLKGFRPAGKNPDAWLKKLQSWTHENSKLLKQVNRCLSVEFPGYLAIDSLIQALDPAMKGEKLSQEMLLEDPVPKQAKRFSLAKQILVEKEGKPIWDKFDETAKQMKSLYPEQTVTHEMEKNLEEKKLPKPKELESLIKKAEEFRSTWLKKIYQLITGSNAPEDRPEKICEGLTEWIVDNKEDIQNLQDQIETEIPHLKLSKLNELLEIALKEELEERTLADPLVKKQAKIFSDARALLEEGIWTQLKDKTAKLQQEHPTSPTTKKLQQSISSDTLPSLEEATKLLSQAEKPKKPKEEGSKPDFERLWTKITELEEDNIILIDVERDSK